MSVQKVLENWSDYDNRKKKQQDANYFSCDERWEEEYLTEKIREAYPHLVRSRISEAIRDCCLSIGGPHPRLKFVTSVMDNLGL